MLKILENSILPILITFLTGIAGYISVKIKTCFQNYINTKIKKEIVKSTVKYIEQVYKNTLITSEDKYLKCKEKALEWLNTENIKVSDTELEILIESAVNDLKEVNK